MLLLPKLERQRRDAFDQLRADTEHALQQPYATEVLGRTVVDALQEVNAGVYLPRIDRHGRVERPKGVHPLSGRVALLPLMNKEEAGQKGLMLAAVVGFDTLQTIAADQNSFMPLEDLMDYPDIEAVHQELQRRGQNPQARTNPDPHGADFRAHTSHMVLGNLTGAQGMAVIANQMTSSAINACLTGHELMHVLDGRSHPFYQRDADLREESERRALYAGVALYRAAGGNYELSATSDGEILDNAARHYAALGQPNPFAPVVN